MTSNSLPAERAFDLRIDFIRFLAFFLVFFTHFINEGGNAITSAENQWWNISIVQKFADFGGQGVPIFFALTGFLLGRLLIREQATIGRVSVRAFLLRRILRIWPLYFLFLLFCLFTNLFASNTPAINNSEIPFYLTFTYNWGQILAGIPGSMATITWSVSVEEQIYLLLPMLLLITRRPRFELVATLFIFLGGLTLFLADLEFLPSGYRQTTSYLLPVGVGLWVAIREDLFRKLSINQNQITWLAFTFSLFYPFAFNMIQRSPIPQVASMLFSSLFFITTLHISDRFFSLTFSCNKFFGRIGRISYGCYLYHWAIWTIMVGHEILFSPVDGFSFIGVLVAFTLTVLVSELSYRYFESWFLRKRKKFQRVISPVV